MAYKLIRSLGKGGFGNVDLVEDDFGKQFACKTFSVNQPLAADLIENVRKRFVKEVRLQKGVNHPNIVPILFDNLDGNPPYYFMPVGEANLDDDICKSRTLNRTFMRAIVDIIAGLEELHALGMCHRDLKPLNVLRFSGNEGSDDILPYYAIGDFGFISNKDSKLSGLTRTGMRKGSDDYTAPELLSDLRNGTPQSDIYSLGCILHDMVGTEDRVPTREIRESGEFGALLLGCTREDPKRRFKSVSSLRDALLSLDASTVSVSDARAEDIVGILVAGADLTEANCQALADFLDDCAGSDDGKIVLGKLSSERISEICKRFPRLGYKIGTVFARWVHDAAFSFESCDALANRLEIFFSECPFDVKVECLLAMLKMGTSHNRWYVERKFVALCGANMDPQLARRLSIEIRAIGSDICHQINHLEWSIKASRNSLHPTVALVLSEICQ